MAAIAESIVYEGIIVYNKETKKFYSFDPANIVDPILGKWREFSGGASIAEYIQDVLYPKNTLIIYEGKMYIATLDFTSSNTSSDIEDDFAIDLDAENIKPVSAEGGASIAEYQQATNYKKDTLIYCGDRMGRATQDFMSDVTRLPIKESFFRDVDAGNIVVDQIDVSELDDQLLKVLPLTAFVAKKDVPRFDANATIAGTVPTLRDGSPLGLTEKKGCSFFYIVDDNGELVGLALIAEYSEEDDEFTVNAMKYGVGVEDDILPTDGVLNKRTVGEIEIVYKDDLLNPKLIVQSTPPIDNSMLWFESNALDASEISVGQVTVKKYNEITNDWDIVDTVSIKDSEVVKNGNGPEWNYYRIYTDERVFISLAKWQLVYDTAQIIGKIIDINNTTHEVTIKTIHANDLSEAALTEDIQANVAIGAAPANFKYEEGMTFTEFVKKIALKDILATATFTASGSGLKKLGTTINGSTLTATITNLGNVGIQTVKFHMGNTLIGQQTYTAGTNTYTEIYSDPIISNTTFSVVIEQDKGYTVNKEAKITFVNPAYIGVVNTLTPSVDDILGLQEVLKESKGGTYTVTMIDKRTCYAYPASIGNLTSIKDNNNFQYLNSFTKTTEMINGETYNVYVLTEPVTATNFTWKFE